MDNYRIKETANGDYIPQKRFNLLWFIPLWFSLENCRIALPNILGKMSYKKSLEKKEIIRYIEDCENFPKYYTYTEFKSKAKE